MVLISCGTSAERAPRITNFELHRGILRNKDGIIRLLAFTNHANMGIYQVAIDQYLDGEVSKPDITNHPLETTLKYGFGVNLEQTLTKNVTAYGRFGWNNGKTESYAYREIDQTFSGGVAVNGRQWGRTQDRFGVALCPTPSPASTSAISRWADWDLSSVMAR